MNAESNSIDQDTIVAQATAPGRSGVGVIRVSGDKAQYIALHLLGQVPTPRKALLKNFKNKQGETLDQGIALYFPKPNSFTGEDVLELQGHGGPVILDQLIQEIITNGARPANPGEFSQRAFLNNKIDLAQAEAIADLIDAGSQQAARSAIRSLSGEFSNKIQSLQAGLTQLRLFIEAAIDFPEEEIDFIKESQVQQDLQKLLSTLQKIKKSAQQGALLQQGINVVIMGEPNVGKSSLLNALSGQDRAIVTDIAGTTRDTLHETIQIDGMPLHLIDTAGLRESSDVIEQEGMRRAKQALQTADVLLHIIDASQTEQQTNELISELSIPKIIIRNKIDLSHDKAEMQKANNKTIISLSAKTGQGIELLKKHLKELMGYHPGEDTFIARRRHLSALTQAEQLIQKGEQQLKTQQSAELLAEDLRLAQQALGEITGEFTSDDLLGKIFSEFCIGK